MKTIMGKTDAERKINHGNILFSLISYGAGFIAWILAVAVAAGLAARFCPPWIYLFAKFKLYLWMEAVGAL